MSGIIFGVAHFLNYFEKSFADVTSQIVYATFIGIFFAAIYYVSKSIWPAVFWHAMIDIAHGFGQYQEPGAAPATGAGVPTHILNVVVNSMVPVVITLPMLFIALYFFKNIKNARNDYAF